MRRRELLIGGGASLIASGAKSDGLLLGAGSQGTGIVLPTVTWNPADTGPNITFSNGNLTASKVFTVASWSTVRATLNKNTGKRYFEITPTVGTNFFIFGVDSTGGILTDQIGALGGSSCGIDCRTGLLVDKEGVFASAFITNSNITQGHVVGIAMDIDAGKIWFSLDGDFTVTIFADPGDPATGANPAATFVANTVLFPAVSLFGNDNVSATIAASGTFAFAPPAGFSAWNA